MSNKLVITAGLGLLLGVSAMMIAQNSVTSFAPHRAISSQPVRLSETFKHLTVLQTKVEILDSSDSEITHLKGTVVMNQNTDGSVRYSWILPEGTEIVSGALADTLINPQINVPQTFEISVRGFMGAPKRDISFIAQMDKGDASPGSVAVITNQEENSLESLRATEFKQEKLRSAH